MQTYKVATIADLLTIEEPTVVLGGGLRFLRALLVICAFLLHNITCYFIQIIVINDPKTKNLDNMLINIPYYCTVLYSFEGVYLFSI